MTAIMIIPLDIHTATHDTQRPWLHPFAYRACRPLATVLRCCSDTPQRWNHSASLILVYLSDGPCLFPFPYRYPTEPDVVHSPISKPLQLSVQPFLVSLFCSHLSKSPSTHLPSIMSPLFVSTHRPRAHLPASTLLPTICACSARASALSHAI